MPPAMVSGKMKKPKSNHGMPAHPTNIFDYDDDGSPPSGGKHTQVAAKGQKEEDKDLGNYASGGAGKKNGGGGGATGGAISGVTSFISGYVTSNNKGMFYGKGSKKANAGKLNSHYGDNNASVSNSESTFQSSGG